MLPDAQGTGTRKQLNVTDEMKDLDKKKKDLQKMSIGNGRRSVVTVNKKRRVLTEQLEGRRLLAGPCAPAAGQRG